MFWGLPDPDPLAKGTAPDPSIIKQNAKNSKKTLIRNSFCDFFMTFFLNMMYIYLQKVIINKT
jgi:hypothetical protein